MAKKTHVSTTINGQPYEFLCEPRQTLLEVLRDVVRKQDGFAFVDDARRVLARQVFHPERRSGADTHALQDPVGKNRKRLARMRAEEKHEARVTLTGCERQLHLSLLAE